MEVAHEALDGIYLRIGENADILVLCGLHHLGGQNTGGAVQRRERLVDLRHLAADGGFLLHDIHGETGIGNVQRRLDTGDTAADDQGPLGDRALACRQRGVEMYFGNGGTAQDNGLFRSRRHILVNPRALFADVGDFHHVGVETGLFRRLAEGGLVHPGRAGADDHAAQVVFLDCVPDHILTRLGAHILIVCGEYHAGLFAKGLGHGLYIHRGGDVGTAPTDEYADSLHSVVLPLLRVFPERTGDGLLGQVLIEEVRDLFGFEMVLALLTDHRQTNGLNELGRLHHSRTALQTGKAGKTIQMPLEFISFSIWPLSTRSTN